MELKGFSEGLVSLQGDLQRFAYKLTNDKEEAHDLLQETTLKALNSVELYREETNLKGWLFTIMRNLFINSYRQVVRRKTYSQESDISISLINYSEEQLATIDECYSLKEIQAHINSLPDSTRVPFQMFLAGFKYREIAIKLNLPLGTVKSRLFATRLRLQDELRDFIE